MRDATGILTTASLAFAAGVAFFFGLNGTSAFLMAGIVALGCAILTLRIATQKTSNVTLSNPTLASPIGEGLPNLPFDLKEIGVEQMKPAVRPDTMMLIRRNNQPLMYVWGNVRCVERLTFQDHIIAKLVALQQDQPPDRAGTVAVYLAGRDTTGQPWIHQVPPDYVNKPIEECERYLLQADKTDEIVAET